MDSSSNTLNILIHCNELSPHSSGGIGMQTLNMANALHALGHQVTIIGIYNDIKNHEHPFQFIQLKRIKKLGFLGHLINVFRFQFYLWKFISIEKNKVDVIEYPDYEGYGFFTFVKTKRLIRLNHPGFYVDGKYAGAKWHEITKYLRWLMIQHSINNADKVITVADYLVPLIKNLSNPKEIETIYNLTNVREETVPQQVLNKKSSPVKSYILNFGTIAQHKGIHLLVTAYMKIADQLSFDLVLAGRISDYNIVKMTNDFCSPKRNNQIIFMDELSPQQLMPIIKKSKGIIFPSFQENMPLAWAEAMGMGKVLWVSDIPVAEEMISDGLDGFIFEKNNLVAIEKALLQMEKIEEGELNEFSKKAQSKYQQYFSTKRLQAKNIACFQSVIQKK